MKPSSRQALLMVAATSLCGNAYAQATGADPAYPTRPIRIVVPFTPGSATDIIARIVGAKLVESWGRPIVTDNRSSAGGIIAGRIVTEASPDGHTLMLTNTSFSGSAALYAKLPYDSIADLSGIARVASAPLIIVVAPTVGVNSVKELIALAKQKPGQLNFGSGGIGTGNHYATELFNLTAGIKGVHVPYRGTPEAFTDVMTGRIQYFLAPVLPAVPLVKSGKVLPLAMTSAQRTPPLLDVPTVAEAGLAGFEFEAWYGLLAPAKTPRKIVDLLSKEVGQIVDLPDVKERIANQGAAAKRSTPEALDKIIRNEIETMKKVWKLTGVEPK